MRVKYDVWPLPEDGEGYPDVMRAEKVERDNRKVCHRAGLLWFFLFITGVVLCGVILPSEATVTGNCSDCHTMHNSQNGASVQILAPGEIDTGPKGLLLRSTCLGCHGQGSSRNFEGAHNNIPQVLHSNAVDLAGGNFAYITGGKTRTSGDSNTVGHNVIDLGFNETVLTSPPGDEHSTDITNMNFTCAGARGCHGDRSIEDKLIAMKGAHHTDDHILKFGSINENSQGSSTGLSYRFLKGVKGGEDSLWEAAPGPTAHNEYKGSSSMGSSSGSSPADNTVSGLCAECHGYFHGNSSSEAGSQDPWLRHPTDILLPSSGEYVSYTTYNLTAPVARTSIPDSPDSTVSPSDAVMCLSCHRAHASPYYKLMRWDYKGWPGNGQTNGCNVCHTSKN
jgi:predicted CXXCH cytochrome family protein